MSEKQTRNNIYLFLLITVCLVTILTSCFPNNPTTPEAVTINKTIELKDSGPKTFSIKSSQGVLPLPFNSSHCGGCQIEAKAHLYYSDNKEEIITQRGGITIGSNGNVSIGASTIGGNLYSGTTVSVVGTMSPASSITGSVSPNMDTSGKPCGYKASHRTHDSSAITIPTYFFRSGNINISLEGKDLVASVSGITSSDEAYWIAPWDGSCRTGSKHPNYITSGTLTVRVKNVVQVTDDDIELTVNPSSIGTESGVTSSTITVEPTNTSKEWKLKINGTKEGCEYTKEYTGTGKKDISWPDADVNSLANGSYSLDGFYTEEPDNKASGSIDVKNKIELKVSIPGKDEDEEKIFSAVAGGSADFKITAGGCPQWKLKIEGKKPDIINSDGSETPGASCEWTKEGSGSSTINWKGTCNDGDLMEDGSYTANLTQGDDSKDDSVKIDNTAPEIDDIQINDNEKSVSLDITLKDPEVNGVSSGLDEDSINVQIPGELAGNVSISGSLIRITIPTNGKNNNGKINELQNSLDNGSLSISASDKVKNNSVNLLNGVAIKAGFTIEEDVDGFNTFSIQSSSPVKTYILGLPCTKIPIKGYLYAEEKGLVLINGYSDYVIKHDSSKAVVSSGRISFSFLDCLFSGRCYKTTTWNGVSRFGNAPSGKYTVEGIRSFAKYFPNKWSYKERGLGNGHFEAKHINDVKKDAISKLTGNPNSMNHIFGPKSLVKHKLDTLVNGGVTPTQIVTELVNSIDFCSLKDGVIDRNYTDPISGTPGLRVDVPALGVQIVIRGLYNKGELHLKTFFIP